MKFVLDGDDGVHFRIRIPSKYQGFDDMVHGGIVCSVLDEVMANCFSQRGADALTVDIHVRLKKMLPLEHDLTAYGKIIEINRGIGYSYGWIEDDDGIRYAEGDGKFFII